MTEIAIYGKGGIGKSTISANLSAALANCKTTVLQIGCDPKHDSTKLLLHGAEQTTVLDYIRTVSPPDYREEDILYTGYAGVGCIEAGGPKPGVGCAGRGIITTFELLEQMHIRQRYDTIIYDVLGDVVCGGFAVPIRREYAKMIFLVTSGEYMALYAANNILRGIRNYDDEDCRVAGIILNRRGLTEETERVKRFAKAVGLPIAADIPRSEEFALAESQSRTLAECLPTSSTARIFHSLAAQILQKPKLYPANPLTDQELAEAVWGTNHPVFKKAPESHEAAPAPKTSEENNALLDLSENNRFLSKSLLYNEPLHGCAFSGSCIYASQISDAVVLFHAPKSCAYIAWQMINSYGRRALYERGYRLPVSLLPNFTCTDMGESEMIFGGMELLTEKIKELQLQKPGAIIVISSCPAGIIGDNVDILSELSTPESPILTLKADGNLAGDSMQGMLLAYRGLAEQLIDRSVQQEPDCVNILFEQVIAKNNSRNFETIKRYLDALGIRINCRFLCNTDCASLRNFMKAPLNLMAYADHTGRVLRTFFQEEYQADFLPQAFPVGYLQSREWILSLAAYFNKKAQADRLLAREDAAYEGEIQQLRPRLKGRKLMIAAYNCDIDWILYTARDLKMEICKIGNLNYPTDAGFRTALDLTLNVEENYSNEKLIQDVRILKPDILLLNYPNAELSGLVPVIDLIPLCPDVGFHSAVNLAKRWDAMLRLHLKGEWFQDEQLFKQYYT